MHSVSRLIIRAAAAVALVVGSAGCSSSSDSSGEAGDATWSYTDSRGEVIELDSRPDSIVALSTIALSLDSYGVELAGQISYGGIPDSIKDSAIADLPIAGDIEVNLEQLAAMDPDVIITLDWGEGVLDSLSGIEDKTAEIAPVLTISATEPLDEQLGDIAELAIALDPQTEEFVSSEAEAFEQAEAAFTAAVQARPEISVAAMQTNTIIDSQPDSANGARIFYADQVGSLGLLANLGLNIIEPDGEVGLWAQDLSAELVNKYPADVILHKVDEWSTGGADVDLDLWGTLPAVQADQVYIWDNTWDVLTYDNWTRVLNEVGAFVSDAQDVYTGS